MGLVTQWAARQLLPDSATIETLLVKAAAFAALAIFAAILVAGLFGVALYGLYHWVLSNGMDAQAAIWISVGFGLCALLATVLIADRVRAEFMLAVSRINPAPQHPQLGDLLLPAVDAFLDGLLSNASAKPASSSPASAVKKTGAADKVVPLKTTT